MLKRRGFTLIELLVVIAIIAILAAILFPVFMAAKEKGRQGTCASNMKQIAVSISLYVDDHNGVMPIAINSIDGHYAFLADALLNYVKTYSIWNCPSGGSTLSRILQTGDVVNVNTIRVRTDSVDYGYNLRFGAVSPLLPNGPNTVRAGEIRRPTQMIMLGDAGWWDAQNRESVGACAIAYCGPGTNLLLNPRGWNYFYVECRHTKGANFAMVDGHVKWYIPTNYERTPSLWDIK